jgi:uncharacterized protein (DUF697 family)
MITREQFLVILLFSILAAIIIVLGIPFSDCMANHPCTGISSCNFWSP